VATDGRIVGVDDPDEKDDEDDEDDSDDGTKTPTARSLTVSLSAVRPSQSIQARMNVEKTILEGSLWGGGGPTVYLRSVDATDLFGSNWLRDPNCVGSDVAALGEDVDE